MPRGVRVCVCGEGGGVVRGGVNLFWLLDARLAKTAENPAFFFFFPPSITRFHSKLLLDEKWYKDTPSGGAANSAGSPGSAPHRPSSAPHRPGPAPRPAPAPARPYLRGTLAERQREAPQQESRSGGAPPVVPRSRRKQHMHPCVDRGDEALPIRD